MNADYNQLSREPLFQLPQLRKFVEAVDSSVGPEVEKHHLAAQILEPDRAVSGVDPVESLWEFGCTNHCVHLGRGAQHAA